MSKNSSLEEAPSPEDLANAKQNKTEITKCATCGANMVYDPDTKALKCPYCGNEQLLDLDNYSEEIELSKLFEDNHNDWGSETHVFRCKNCGATEILSKTEISKKCSFCGTSNVVETDSVSGLKPNGVLPFILSKETACGKVIVWAKKKIMAPRKFKKSVQPEETYGNYYPSFTFDSQTESSYQGRLGEYYYVTVRRNGKSYSERRIRWFSVSGDIGLAFDDILIQAMENKNQKTINGLKPFDTNHSQEYSSDFLQGFSATQYTKSGDVCWGEAQTEMKNGIRKSILARYKHDTVDYLNINSKFYDSTFKYVLLPVYIGHCNYAKKIYNFYVNGQTGKVTGKTPISPVKVFFVVLVIILIICLIAWLYQGEM